MFLYTNVYISVFTFFLLQYSLFVVLASKDWKGENELLI